MIIKSGKTCMVWNHIFNQFTYLCKLVEKLLLRRTKPIAEVYKWQNYHLWQWEGLFAIDINWNSGCGCFTAMCFPLYFYEAETWAVIQKNLKNIET